MIAIKHLRDRQAIAATYHLATALDRVAAPLVHGLVGLALVHGLVVVAVGHLVEGDRGNQESKAL